MEKGRNAVKAAAKRAVKKAVKKEVANNAPTEMEEASGWIDKEHPQDPQFKFSLKIGKSTLEGVLHIQQPLQGIVPATKAPKPVNPAKKPKKKKD